jgi:hypothetical protein
MELIRRITVIRRGDEGQQSVTVYRAPRRRRRVSLLSRPFERAARELLRAQIVFGQEALRRHERSNRRRRDGWLVEGPANIMEAGRKAFNQARKGVPFRLVPKL